MENKKIIKIEAATNVEKKDPTEKYTILNYKLTKPVTFEGKEYKELVLDFGSLTGNDAIAIEEEMEAMNLYVMAPETSRAYQIRMAARAGGFPYQLTEQISFRDFTRLANAARNFLVGQEL